MPDLTRIVRAIPTVTALADQIVTRQNDLDNFVAAGFKLDNPDLALDIAIIDAMRAEFRSRTGERM